MWNVEAKVTTVIRGATGPISKSLRQYLSNITGKQKFRNYRNSHIGHCTLATDSDNAKVQNIFHGRNNIECSTDCK
jgi:hypothetical protein